MGIEVTGKLHTIFDTAQVTERFRKREFVLEMGDNPKYPQVVLFQLTGNRCEQLEDFAVGDEVRVDFSLRGREWTSPRGEVKFFNSLDVWTLSKISGSHENHHDNSDGPPPLMEEPPGVDDDDLPF